MAKKAEKPKAEPKSKAKKTLFCRSCGLKWTAKEADPNDPCPNCRQASIEVIE